IFYSLFNRGIGLGESIQDIISEIFGYQKGSELDRAAVCSLYMCMEGCEGMPSSVGNFEFYYGYGNYKELTKCRDICNEIKQFADTDNDGKICGPESIAFPLRIRIEKTLRETDAFLKKHFNCIYENELDSCEKCNVILFSRSILGAVERDKECGTHAVKSFDVGGPNNLVFYSNDNRNIFSYFPNLEILGIDKNILCSILTLIGAGGLVISAVWGVALIPLTTAIVNPSFLSIVVGVTCLIEKPPSYITVVDSSETFLGDGIYVIAAEFNPSLYEKLSGDDMNKYILAGIMHRFPFYKFKVGEKIIGTKIHADPYKLEVIVKEQKPNGLFKKFVIENKDPATLDSGIVEICTSGFCINLTSSYDNAIGCYYVGKVKMCNECEDFETPRKVEDNEIITTCLKKGSAFGKKIEIENVGDVYLEIECETDIPVLKYSCKKDGKIFDQGEYSPSSTNIGEEEGIKIEMGTKIEVCDKKIKLTALSDFFCASSEPRPLPIYYPLRIEKI
ncbi:MAG: hypothetical protein J7L39_02400, partial [Candidatus Aenigmarchaeota archaeon]|nr:hypothetical protein [Candidatus Aenigmarchaeota archaeon]